MRELQLREERLDRGPQILRHALPGVEVVRILHDLGNAQLRR